MLLPIVSAVLAVALAITITMLWSVFRVRRASWKDVRHLECGPRFEAMAARLTLGDLNHGSRLTVLENGDGFFPALFEALENAESSIHFETFLWSSGELTARLTACLLARADAGVSVRVIIDGQGEEMTERERKRLTGGKASIAFFKRPRIRSLGVYNQRDHRKLVIVDGKIGFIGGHCITDAWLGDAESKDHARDISLRVEGPVVNAMQAAFSENWTEETGQLLAEEGLFPELPEVGEARAHLAYINVARRVSSVKILHMLAISSARESITIQNPYFIPDLLTGRALGEAVARGVRVRVMIPTIRSSDSKFVQHATHQAIGPLLEAGVEIYGYDRALLHQKVFVIDGEWIGVGSCNFDFRSFEINDEITLSGFDRTTAAELERVFDKDLDHAKRFTFEWWQSRPWHHRLRDRTCHLFRAQL